MPGRTGPVYGLIIFDLDGTLVDSAEFHARAFELFFGRLPGADAGFDFSGQAGGTVRDCFAAAGIGEDGMDAGFEALSRFYREREARALLELTRAAPGIVSLTQWLRSRRISLAVVTNSLQDAADLILRRHGLHRLFDAVDGADAGNPGKGPRCQRICERFGARPETVLLVGDTEGDLVLAEQLGYDACFMKTPIGWHEDGDGIVKRRRPALVAESFESLGKQLAREAAARERVFGQAPEGGLAASGR